MIVYSLSLIDASNLISNIDTTKAPLHHAGVVAPVGLKVIVPAVLSPVPPVPLPLHPLAEVVAAGARVPVVESGHQELLLLLLLSASHSPGIRGLLIK